MNTFTGKIRTPVRREGASRYLLITLLSFAVSVSLTRLFLQLTGYPQIGSGPLHIAHVLWGGLLLFLAAMLPLLLANRWVYSLSAVLAGVGVGLFIDEVGKFITQANNYFYPPAAPIIYVFFLLIVLIYLQIRRPPSRDPRAVFYRAFEGLQEVLDQDLDPAEQAELIAELQTITAEAKNENLTRLATELLHFLEHDNLYLAPVRPGLRDRTRQFLSRLEGRWLTKGRFRIGLAGGLATLGAMQLTGLARVALAAGESVKLEQLMSGWILNNYVSSGGALGWFLARLALEASVGALLLIAAILLILRKDRLGSALSILSLLLSLATVDLLASYFNQFSAILPAGVQFTLLLIALRYRGKYFAAPQKQISVPNVRSKTDLPSAS